MEWDEMPQKVTFISHAASLQRHIATPYSRCCIATSINLRYVEGSSLHRGIMAMDRGDFLAISYAFMLKAP